MSDIQGEQGERGEKGDVGVRGDQGVRGVQGDRGKAAPGSNTALAKLDNIATEFRGLSEALREAARRQRLRNLIEGVGVALLVIFLLVALALFGRMSTAISATERQAVTNDVDILDHRIADKQRSQCSEQYLRDVITELRKGPTADLNSVQGCFNEQSRLDLEALKARREAVAVQLSELDSQARQNGR